MKITRFIKHTILKIVGQFTYGQKFLYARTLYNMNNAYTESFLDFYKEYQSKLNVVMMHKSKAEQIAVLLKKVLIDPIENNTFFYSIDYFKTLKNQNLVLHNYTVNYEFIIRESLGDTYEYLSKKNGDFAQNELIIITALHDYYKRICNLELIVEKYGKAVDAIGSLFERPAHTFFEGLQRILFFNQFLWQTGHKLNGLNRLDKILIGLYKSDIAEGRMTAAQAYTYVKDFFCILHQLYEFKSNEFLGDTGQIIILGGLDQDGTYNCNELTKLFIEVSMELRLPDPKILLRCSSQMPNVLLQLALECISTGIGAPFLSNDDVVIPALVSYGYDPVDAYNYVTAACWEPLIPDNSCEQCNVSSFNFAIPFLRMADAPRFETLHSVGEILDEYRKYLEDYTSKILTPLSALSFEEDPLISLLSYSSMKKQKDITRGGAKYYNLGLTSVGMGTVVNSILNINKFVFKQNQYTLHEFNTIRKNNFVQNEMLRHALKNSTPCYGCDDREVIDLTNRIMNMASMEFKKYKTKYGGRFKIGLSAPSYVDSGKKTEATFDGRIFGEPFSVHISAVKSIPTTELLHFAMQLDYTENCINGNVIDFIVSPEVLNKDFAKYIKLLKTGFEYGIYQLQMNVVSSKTLIAAKDNPELFPNLVVRVWGFSAYFNDLPDEYKHILIMRALESEKGA